MNKLVVSAVALVAGIVAMVQPSMARDEDDRLSPSSTSIVGSWTCESGQTPVGALGLLTTFSADNTFQIGTDSAAFGETHGVFRRLDAHRFQSFDKAFLYNAQGFGDQVRVARAIETVLTKTTMRINVDITIEDRNGVKKANFPAVFACDRMLVGQ